MHYSGDEMCDLFFDATQSFRSSVDSCSYEDVASGSPQLWPRGFGYEDVASGSPQLRAQGFGYEFWASEPSSVSERREWFLRSMGFDEFMPSRSVQRVESPACSASDRNIDVGIDRLNECSGAVLDPLSPPDGSINMPMPSDSLLFVKDLDSWKKIVVRGLGLQGVSTILREVGTGKMFLLQDFESIIGFSRSIQRFLHRESAFRGSKLEGPLNTRKKQRKRWWRNLTFSWNKIGFCKQVDTTKNPIIRRATSVKKYVDFTAMYDGHEIQDRKGLIGTIKFSPCGRHMASGGKDCVVRIWRIKNVEVCGYTANGLSRPVDGMKSCKLMPRRSFYSAPLVPKKLFVIEDAPLQELRGHSSDILDLSWAKSELLLTSSKDCTVRLWKVVDSSECLKVFHHNDYVTSIQFNPIDENYFISGSIDGKVRIWEVAENRVVDWVDVRDIVTAVCYVPNGKGFLVGSITGNCRFYDNSGKNIQLRTQFCNQVKKKSSGKPIISLQLSPGDTESVKVVSADCKVQTNKGLDVVSKFKGHRNLTRQLSASYRSDGRYLISMGEGCHVYIWNYKEVDISNKRCKSLRSCKNDLSEGVLLALPWPSLDNLEPVSHDSIEAPWDWKTPGSSGRLRDPDRSLGVWFCADTCSRAVATWPEEKLLPCNR